MTDIFLGNVLVQDLQVDDYWLVNNGDVITGKTYSGPYERRSVITELTITNRYNRIIRISDYRPNNDFMSNWEITRGGHEWFYGMWRKGPSDEEILEVKKGLEEWLS